MGATTQHTWLGRVVRPTQARPLLEFKFPNSSLLFLSSTLESGDSMIVIRPAVLTFKTITQRPTTACNQTNQPTMDFQSLPRILRVPTSNLSFFFFFFKKKQNPWGLAMQAKIRDGYSYFQPTIMVQFHSHMSHAYRIPWIRYVLTSETLMKVTELWMAEVLYILFLKSLSRFQLKRLQIINTV